MSPDFADLLAPLLRFGDPVGSMHLSMTDLQTPDTVVQIGVPPNRIDLLTSATGLRFESAWAGRVIATVASLSIPFLGREALIENKRACGRPKDLADLSALEG